MQKKDLQQLFDNNMIGAVTVDTNIFYDEGKSVTEGVFPLLSQVNKAGLRLLFPDVVTREMVGLIKERYEVDQVNDSKAVARIAKWLPRDLVATLNDHRLAAERDAELDFESFLLSTNAQVIKAECHVPIGALLDRYFLGTAPFSGKKKDEFPDAIALLTLEAWAQNNAVRVLCVSRDGDWANYCKTSLNLKCTDNLEDVLAALLSSRKEELSTRLVRPFQQLLGTTAMLDKITAELDSYLDRTSPDIEAEVDCHWDAVLDASRVVPGSIRIGAGVDLISVDASSVVFSVPIHYDSENFVMFNFWVCDGVDRDDVSIGYGRVTQNTPMAAMLTITLDVESFLEGSLPELSVDNVQTIEAKHRPFVIHCGRVAPGYD